MTDLPSRARQPSIDSSSQLKSSLIWSARLWFSTALIGQWIFVYYVAAHYLPKFWRYGLPGLSHTEMPGGYVPGDWLGNLAIAAHVVLAVLIIGGGPLQLIPTLRQRLPALHRWNGRLYLLACYVTALGGAYLVWTRGVPGGPLAPWAITLDALLIMLFGAIALRFAMKRQIAAHRRWALRLFMVVSAVWFFRIGLMAWFMLTGGVGIDIETFTGPFITFIYFGQMFVPLAFLELYFWAAKSPTLGPKLAVAIAILAATGVTAVGVFAATMGMWLPRI